ncbi:MAG: hypothetical protein KDA24_18010 [Deltaproteobacteria bacterium]|nr:hypothetical protein [Deltaproteobacteria bacterium]
MDSSSNNGDMEAQLVALYEEKELLEQELGISSADLLIAMVRSMEEQLIALYTEKETSWRSATSPASSSSESR